MYSPLLGVRGRVFHTCSTTNKHQMMELWAAPHLSRPLGSSQFGELRTTLSGSLSLTYPHHACLPPWPMCWQARHSLRLSYCKTMTLDRQAPSSSGVLNPPDATIPAPPQTDNSCVCAEGLIFSKFGNLCGRTREKKVCILHRHDHMHESL